MKTVGKHYSLILLMVISAFNGVDVQALGLALQDIKTDLALSDTQLGVLTGIAFALFYAVVGIPIARWADRGNRVTIIAVTTAVWSVAVALCGIAGNFLQLLLIRVVVASGEAGGLPPAHSLIADYFERGERPRAVSIYLLGAPLSVLLGYFLAGWLNEFYGWRVMFLSLGAPGLMLAALAVFTLREPRAQKLIIEATGEVVAGSDWLPETATAGISHPTPSLREVCVTLWTNRTFRHLLYSFSVLSFFGGGLAQWQPAFLIRSYGLKTGELGTWFTLIYGLGGFLGIYWSGQWASRRAVHNERLQLKVIAIVCASSGVIWVSMYLSGYLYLVFGLMSLAAVGMAVISGPLFATLQTLVPERMRAMSVAVFYLFSNLIGMGLGPLAVGALSDSYHPLWGTESLRYALVTMCPGYLWCAWHLWRASKTVTADVARVQGHRQEAIKNHRVEHCALSLTKPERAES